VHQKGDMKQIPHQGSQILGTMVQNSVTQVTWCLGFVHPCFSITLKRKYFVVIKVKFKTCTQMEYWFQLLPYREEVGERKWT
jgi:hypothetical protein